MRALALAVVLAAGLVGCGGPAVIWSGHTHDRRRHVEVIADAGRHYVVVDGERRAAYRAIAAWSVELSDDGHLAFAAQVGRHWVVVRDGRAGEPWDAIGELVLGPGGRLAYAAERAGRWHVVDGDVAGPPFDAILAGSLVWSVDGRVGYVAADGGGHRAVVDGTPGPRYDGIGRLGFTAGSGRVVYTARRGRAAHVVIDGEPGPAWRAVAHLTRAPAGDRVAYAALDDDDWRVIVDGEPGPAVDAVRRLVFRGDGRHLAWVAEKDGHDVLALDGTPIAAAPSLRADTVVFGPGDDTPALAPIAPVVGDQRAPAHVEPVIGGRPALAHVEPVAGGGERVVVDGVAGATYDEISRPVWSATGSLAYAARRGAVWCLVVDGRERRGGDWLGDPVWSRDGRRLAYLVRRGRAWSAIVDGKAFPFDLILDGSFAFSTDNRHWSVVAGDLKRERLFFAIDGTRRIPLTPLEIYSAAARNPRSPLDTTAATDGDVLLRWSQAEADLASAPPPQR